MKTHILLTTEYNRKRIVTVSDEWLEDLPQAVDEMMEQQLNIGSPFSFCAPEIIRDAITHHILKTDIQ